MIRRDGVREEGRLLDSPTTCGMSSGSDLRKKRSIGPAERCARSATSMVPRAGRFRVRPRAANEEAYLFQKLVADRLSHQQRRSLYALVSAHRSRHCSKTSARGAVLESGPKTSRLAEVASRDRGATRPVNPSGRGDVHEERGEKRNQRSSLMDPAPFRSLPAADDLTSCSSTATPDVALLNGMMHVIIAEGLANDVFIAERTENYEALKATSPTTARRRSPRLTGIDAQDDRARWAAPLCDCEGGDHLLGHGHSSQPGARHRQRALR